MRQGSGGRRTRGRSGGRKNVPLKMQNFDSNGPDVRVRGNANQVYEKYLALARDANSVGDRVGAESYYQHAEHYYRILSDSTDPQLDGQGREVRPQPRGDGQDRGGRDRDERPAAEEDGDQPEAQSAGERSGREGGDPRGSGPRRGRGRRGNGRGGRGPDAASGGDGDSEADDSQPSQSQDDQARPGEGNPAGA